MKFSVALPVAFTLPALAYGYSVRGYDMFGRPITIRGQSRCSPAQPSATQSREAFRRQTQQKRAVDQAFDDLMNDLNRPASEEVITKSKEWVDRSFGLFSELNRDVAASQDELERNEELLRKQQKWANKLIDFASELGQDVASVDPLIEVVPSNGGGGDSNQELPAPRDKTIAPLYSIKDDTTVFQVELELPGVSLDDIAIELEQETNVLVITGHRRSIGSDEPTKFSKRFMLESIVDTENISAKLNNGILTVTAPKKEKKTADNTKKIQISSGE